MAAQRARGPDNEASIDISGERASVVFGHNRLSVIDLSSEANQPMWDASGSVCIVYNGEIYNYIELRRELADLGHSFRTESDTEVILEAYKQWGVDSPARLNGMFSFAVFDLPRSRLWLVRDRFGVKPLYYAVTGDRLHFASTPGPLARALSLRPNLDYVARGLRYWVFEDSDTASPYAGVDAVPPGHWISVELVNGRPALTTGRYYDLQSRIEARIDDLYREPERRLVSRVADCLQDAVTLRLRADVPIGISLSGGLDSASVAAFAAKHHSDVRVFSHANPEDPASEGLTVSRLAERWNLHATYVWPRGPEVTNLFWEALEAQDAPFPSLSIVAQYAVFKEARRHGMKVLLGGQGADEIFMGYRKYHLVALMEAIRARGPAAIARAAAGLATLIGAELPSAGKFLRQRQRYLGGAGMPTRLRLPETSPVSLGYRAESPAWSRQLLDVTLASLPTLLRYEDRNSMANSLETRLPFLDYRVVELGLALPTALKVRGGFGKWALRAGVRGRVPDDVRLARRKRNFEVDERRWITDGLGASIRSRLQSHLARVRELLPDQSDVSTLFSDDRLATNSSALAEATSLIWIAERA